MNDQPIAVQDLHVTDEDAGVRVDRFLALKLIDLSRSRLKALIKQGQVKINDVLVLDPNRRLKSGERVVVDMPEPEDPVPQAEDIQLDVMFEDEHLIVINKPSGLVVHPGAGNWTGTLVNGLIGHCGDSLSGIGGVKRPGIVHRLDKETSGVMVVAKTDAAHKSLSDQFASHGKDGRMQRAYMALVWGRPPHAKGLISAPIGRSSGNRTKMAVVREEDGRLAVTHYERIETFKTVRDGVTDGVSDGASDDENNRHLVTLVRCVLETGRTHQIRVHMAHLGCPLLGDTTYGSGFKASMSKLGEAAQAALLKLDGQALHAQMLGFEHPSSGRAEKFTAEPPYEINKLIQCLRDEK